MRFRMSRRQVFLRSRPMAAETAGEWIRSAGTSQPLIAAAYPLPASEQKTERGIVRVSGFTLVLPPDSDLQPGDLLRAVSAQDVWYEVAEVRRYPGQIEGKALRRGEGTA